MIGHSSYGKEKYLQFNDLRTEFNKTFFMYELLFVSYSSLLIKYTIQDSNSYGNKLLWYVNLRNLIITVTGNADISSKDNEVDSFMPVSIVQLSSRGH